MFFFFFLFFFLRFFLPWHRRYGDLPVPVFLMDVARYFLQRAGVPGILDSFPGLEGEVNQLKKQLSCGFSYDIPATTHPRSVFVLLQAFLRCYCSGCFAHYDTKEFVLQAISAASTKGKSDVQVYEALQKMLQNVESIWRRIFIELVHIFGLILDNQKLSGCPLEHVASQMLQSLFFQAYDTPDEQLMDHFGSVMMAAASFRSWLRNDHQAPFLGGPVSQLCSVHTAWMQTEPVSGLCCTDDGKRLWVLAKSGQAQVLDSQAGTALGTLKLSQPLFLATQVGAEHYFMRGEMSTELCSLANKDTLKLAKNARCFVHLPWKKQVWGGSEGTIHNFDSVTGALIGSFPCNAELKPRCPVRFLVVCGQLVVAACGASIVRLFADDGRDLGILGDGVLVPSPSLGEWSGFCSVPGPLPCVLGCTTSGKLVSFTVAAGGKAGDPASWAVKELETSRQDIRFLAIMDDCAFSTSGRDLLVFSISRWVQLGVIRTPHPMAIKHLAASATRVFTTCAADVLLVWTLMGTPGGAAYGGGGGAAGAGGSRLGGSVVGRSSAAGSSAVVGSTATTTLAGSLDEKRGLWQRVEPSRSLTATFLDVRSGASIPAEEIEVDPSRVLAEERYGSLFIAHWRGIEVAMHDLSLESFSRAEIEEIQQRIEDGVVSHPRMCHLYCYSLLGPRLKLVTSAESILLTNKLREKSLRFRARMRIAEHVAQFLAFLHVKSPPILHLDLTVDSVRLDEHFSAHVDNLYSVTRIRNLHLHGSSPSLSKAARAMPPELLQDKPAVPTPAADVYMFGMFLWALVEQSSTPFRQVENFATLRSMVCVNHERPPLTENMPASLRGVILECWSPDPALRPTMAQLIANDVFNAANFDHTLTDAEAHRFWLGMHSGSRALETSGEDFIREFQRRIPGMDIKTSQFLDSVFKTWLIKEGRVSVQDFGDFVQLFCPFSVTKAWIDGVVADLSVVGVLGIISSKDADARLKNAGKGDYCIRFASDIKSGLRLHVKGISNSKTLVRKQGGWTMEGSKAIHDSLEALIRSLQSELLLKKPILGGAIQEAYHKFFPTKEEEKATSKAVKILSSNYVMEEGVE